jgi:hypothetical protein
LLVGQQRIRIGAAAGEEQTQQNTKGPNQIEHSLHYGSAG